MKILRTLLNVRFDNDYIDGDVKVRDHCHITAKYRVSAHRDCNVNLKLNRKIPVVFENLKNYDSHYIMLELDKCNLKNKCHTKWIGKVYEL